MQLKHVLVKMQEKIVLILKLQEKHVFKTFVLLKNVLITYNVLIIQMELYVLQIKLVDANKVQQIV